MPVTAPLGTYNMSSYISVAYARRFISHPRPSSSPSFRSPRLLVYTLAWDKMSEWSDNVIRDWHAAQPVGAAPPSFMPFRTPSMAEA